MSKPDTSPAALRALADSKEWSDATGLPIEDVMRIALRAVAAEKEAAELVPPGWKLAPVVASKEMLKAAEWSGDQYHRELEDSHPFLRQQWEAMMAAA